MLDTVSRHPKTRSKIDALPNDDDTTLDSKRLKQPLQNIP